VLSEQNMGAQQQKTCADSFLHVKISFTGSHVAYLAYGQRYYKVYKQGLFKNLVFEEYKTTSLLLVIFNTAASKYN
jgi:hypothetical protein